MLVKKISITKDRNYCNAKNIVICTYKTIDGAEFDGIISDDSKFKNYKEIEVIDNNDIL